MPRDDDPADDGTQQAGGMGLLLWQVSNLWQRQMRRALADLGLTHVQFALLSGLARLERRRGQVTQADLAAHCHVDPMMTSQVLRALETSGHVARIAHPTDTRAKCPTLTRSGHHLVAKAAPLAGAVDEAFFALAGQRGDRLTKSLRKLRRRAETAAAGIDAT